MLSLKNVAKDYYVGKERISILKDINVTINQGDFVTIVGPSGCGKTTLLNLISGLDTVSTGTITFDGKCIENNKDKQWSIWRKCKIGYIFQNFNLIEFMNARQNVELVLQANGIRKEERRKRAKELLKKVGLSEREKYLPAQLSGGQKQRVAIARALANNPHILLADEPTGAVDSATSQEIMNLLKSLNKNDNVTIIMVTHDEKLANQATRKIKMFDGKIVSDEHSEAAKTITKPPENKVKKSLPFTELLIAIKNIATKKKRTLLTSIGTSIGIAGVLLVCGIGSGAKNRIMEELNTIANMQLVTVRETDTKMSEHIQTVLLQDERILDIHPYNSPSVFCQLNDTICEGLVNPIGPLVNSKKHLENKLLYGQPPQQDNSHEAIISLTMAKKLAGNENVESLLGSEITMAFMARTERQIAEIITHKIKIVGISGKAFLGVTDIVNIPYLLAEQVVSESLRAKNYHSDTYCVTLRHEKDSADIKNMINEMGFNATTDIEAMGSIGIIIDLVTAVIMLLASISLIVSGIMIALVTYMGVTERIREIGILRAVGFSAKNIKRIFLTEGAIVGVSAGILGVIGATLVGNIVNSIINTAFSEIAFTLYQVSKGQIIFCILFSTFIGIFCAVSPARKASKTEPINALGYVH